MLALVFVVGCGKAEPVLTKVSGRITNGGKPVNKVEVRFVPSGEGLGDYIGAGISDEDGNFTIAIPGRKDELCCTGNCKVTVREAPLPGDVRGRLESKEGRGGGGGALMQYKASLKNRPIPRAYERLHSTPLTFNVTTDKSEGYDIEL